MNFMSLLWVDNPLYHLSNEKDMNVSIAIYGSAFPRPILELIDAPLPDDLQERAEQLDDRIQKRMNSHGQVIKWVRLFCDDATR